jgi:hypothetical protein
LVNVPFFSIINFSNTWGIGVNGERSIKIAPMIRIGYEILSRNFHMCILRGGYESKNWKIGKLG